MKEAMMLLGFGMGLITGALLYKYSQNAKQMVDNSEKKVMKQVEKVADEVKSPTKKTKKKAQA